MIYFLYYCICMICVCITAPSDANIAKAICLFLAIFCFIGANACWRISKDRITNLEKHVKNLAEFNLQAYEIINHNADMGNDLLKRMEDEK